MEERKSVPYPLYAQIYTGSVPIGIEPVFMLAFSALSGKEAKMIIKWKFTDGTVSEVEVEKEIGSFILDSRRKEENANRNCRRNNYSLDAITYEGMEYSYEDAYPSETMTMNDIAKAMSKLTPTQRRRLLKRLQGKTIAQIAKEEGAADSSVFESIESGKNNLKNFLSQPE